MATKKTERSFEESLARLEEILRTLESGESDLAAMLGLYEEGVALIRSCNDQLTRAEQSVKMLQLGANGELTLKDFKENGEQV